MHGGLQNPVQSPAHRSEYDALMDSDINNSEICGSCHDLVTVAIPGHGPGNVASRAHVRRVEDDVLQRSRARAPPVLCGGCHMISSTDVVADAPSLDVPLRPNGFPSTCGRQWIRR